MASLYATKSSDLAIFVHLFCLDDKKGSKQNVSH